MAFDNKLPLTSIRKVRLDRPRAWDHHRGGWKSVCRLLTSHLHADDGVELVTAVEDDIFDGKVFLDPWVGFLHQVPKHSLPWFPDLERLLMDPRFKASLASCQGLFVLSTVLKTYLEEQKIPVPVARIHYPFEPTDCPFRQHRFAERSPRRLLYVGEYLRDFEALARIKAPGYEKVLLRPDKFDQKSIAADPSIKILERVDDDEYDALLEESLVFLSLKDAPANTTVVECIARGTPLLINRLPGIVEYLGEDYPFYYDSLEEATEKLGSDDLIQRTSRYLLDFPGRKALTPEHFLQAIQNSAIYRSLPTPPSHKSAFRTYDVSIVICSYKRVYNLDRLFQALVDQDYEGAFEVLVWNNNYDTRLELDALYEKYRNLLDMRMTQSTENYYCIIRMAVASLVRSEVLLIVDDDVIPSPGYVRRFMDKRVEYGDEAVLCCRGHVFLPHKLNEEEPHQTWCDFENMRFYDERTEDRQIHFLHADNCLIPKAVMQKAVSIPLERYEFILVDDYWLSYVFSERLQVPIWKIRADDVVQFSSCADDPQIALFHNPRVTEQRVNLYISVMRKGWPHPQEDLCSHQALVPAPDQELSKTAIWRGGFRGANMFSESHDHDFQRAASMGIRVVRFGAVGATQDLRYLVDEKGTRARINSETVGRLIKALRKAESYGLKAILTFCNLPGRLVRAQDCDLRMWADESVAESFIDMWGELARHLRHCENLIGYDLINEPFAPKDTAWDLEDSSPNEFSDRLNRLYRRTIERIRSLDPDTPIILEGTRWGSPHGLPLLEPSSDERTIYSFHMYVPPLLTNRSQNDGRYTYPGPVPVFNEAVWKDEQVYWDKARLKLELDRVRLWQERHSIEPRRIFVGEFGVCRDIVGAQQYLTDLMDLFDGAGWNWCYYAFRDDEWDAMNYELGPDLQNMLAARKNDLMQTLSDRFK